MARQKRKRTAAEKTDPARPKEGLHNHLHQR